jgi:hypothetical protein
MPSLFINQHNNPVTNAALTHWFKFNGDLSNSVGSATLSKDTQAVISYGDGVNGINQYIDFDGKGLGGLRASAPLITPGAFTLCFWHYHKGSIDIYRNTQSYGDGNGVSVRLQSTTWDFYRKVNNLALVYVSNTHGIPLDTWAHVSIVFSSGYVSYYRDGVYVNNASVGTGTWTDPGTNTWTLLLYRSLCQDYRVYSGALSADEIMQVYKYLG